LSSWRFRVFDSSKSQREAVWSLSNGLDILSTVTVGNFVKRESGSLHLVTQWLWLNGHVVFNLVVVREVG
jgi:hypothetical protein